MTNIYGLMVIKNEEQRYLHSALKDATSYLDNLFVFDDQSEDRSAQIASEFAEVVIRPDHVSSFLDNESEFREAAWSFFEDTFRPTMDDWILVIDSDEFLVGDDRRSKLESYTDLDLGVTMRIPELWEMDPPRIRVDGFWDSNSSHRYFRYMPGAEFLNRRMGCPPFPTYVRSDKIVDDVEILHVGYLNPDDRVKKHERYSLISEGHSSSHVSSIIKKPAVYEIYDGYLPNIYRGIL